MQVTDSPVFTRNIVYTIYHQFVFCLYYIYSLSITTTLFTIIHINYMY